ncbi:MAG: DUF4286 family protein [Bacteroidia bacterium]|nr:DUF4286 family protein [Bacteroidia bacterium]
MLVYSVTVSLDEGVREAWLSWMRDDHIPAVMATGYFRSFEFLELLEPAPEPGTCTFNIQYRCPDQVSYETYLAREAPALRQDHENRFGQHFVAFRTLLRTVS